MQTFFENRSAKIYYNASLDSLYLEYTDKVANHEQFVVINRAVLTAFEKLHTKKCAVDLRKMGVIGIESQKWVVDVLIPGMIKHLDGQVPIIAQLLDEAEIFARFAANKINEKANDDNTGLQIKQFTDRAKMEAYLKSV